MHIGLLKNGKTFTAETVNELSQLIDEYITNIYGDCYVYNCKKGSTYAKVNIISSPGSYIIHQRENPEQNKVLCIIS